MRFNRNQSQIFRIRVMWTGFWKRQKICVYFIHFLNTTRRFSLSVPWRVGIHILHWNTSNLWSVPELYSALKGSSYLIERTISVSPTRSNWMWHNVRSKQVVTSSQCCRLCPSVCTEDTDLDTGNNHSSLPMGWAVDCFRSFAFSVVTLQPTLRGSAIITAQLLKRKC
jgi:hypothetical protein